MDTTPKVEPALATVITQKLMTEFDRLSDKLYQEWFEENALEAGVWLGSPVERREYSPLPFDSLENEQS
jgi:hypothetical protein